MLLQPTPIEQITHPILKERKIELFVKRDDLIHPEMMGNKWRKLKYNLQQAQSLGKKTLLTMGGAYSNHIYATAAAGEAFNLRTIGIIRGDELSDDSNETLRFAKSKGMRLDFVDRKTFSTIRKNPEPLLSNYPDAYFLPEGGTNELAIKGVKELLLESTLDFDIIATAIGTGGTFCGLLSGAKVDQHVLGVSALKGDFIHEEIRTLLKKFKIDNSNYSLQTTFHFGGYGKITNELIGFIDWFKENFHIPLDPIYTGKSFFGVWNMINNGKFKENLKIVLLHTGGLQGISGVNRKKEDLIR